MKLSVSTIAQLASDIYTPAVRTWNLMLVGPKYGNSTVGCLINPATCVIQIACQGTDSAMDFWKDIESVAPDSQGLPNGFDVGMRAVYQRLRQVCGTGWTIILTGHSLGAAQAAILHVLFAAGGLIPSAAVLLACPRCVALSGPNVYSFRNGSDPVPDVPLGFQRPYSDIRLSMPPVIPELALEWHHVVLYLKGIAALALPEFDALPARSTIMTTVTATPAVAVTTAAHLDALQSLESDISSAWSKFLSVFQSASAVETQALPTEIALASIGAAAAGAPAAIPVIQEAGTAAEALGAANASLSGTVTPTNLSSVLLNGATLANAISTTIAAASGKPAPSALTTAAAAAAAAAGVVAAVPAV